MRDVIRVIDSSLHATVPFPVFPTRNSYPPFIMTIGGQGVIMREMLIVILNECEGSIPVVRKAVKCHSEQERRRLSDYLLLHKIFKKGFEVKDKKEIHFRK